MRFRIRSSARDENADARRLRSIEQSLSTAIAEAESEEEGLRRQIDIARARASAMVERNVQYPDREREKRNYSLDQAEFDLG